MRRPDFRKLTAAGLGLVLVAFAADRALPPDLGRLDDASVMVVDRDGGLLRAFTTDAGAWRLPAEPDAVSPLFRAMLLAYEDRRFHWHPGVDPLAVMRAVGQMIGAGQVVSGASTITMQTARLLDPRARTIWAKTVEMVRAVQLEARFSKDRILAQYLTLAPYGGNLEGVRAASLAYFGKEPVALTPDEAALLVALPQSPERLRPDRFPEAARAARDKVLALMVERGVLDAGQAAEAAAEPVPTARRALPFEAPHLTRALAERSPPGAVSRSTIDAGLQEAVTRLANATLPGLDPRSSIAVLVVETDGRAVRAYLGSPGFFDTGRAGQVDMVRAVRSPGSTLKPFIYGMAFDDLLVHPETIVADRPAVFGGYRPENFRRVYHGEVPVRVALQKSLNIPAVEVLEGVGPVRFSRRLREAGAKLHLAPGSGPPGLPVALGGAGMTLWDLTTLYAGLADGGAVRPLRTTAAAAEGDAVPVVAPASAWQLARILENAPPPADFVAAANARRGRSVAFKTGTSYGFRDAWAVGYDGRHTVGVWIGRPDGAPSPGQYGLETAAPLLFDVFGLLPPGPPPMPDGTTEGGLLHAANRDLPPGMQRFGRAARASESIVEASPETLRITFPPDGALIEMVRDEAAVAPLTLAATGGVKPLKWLVNGRPVDAPPHRRDAQWTPDGAGFVHVTVVDGAGASVSAEARLR